MRFSIRALLAFCVVAGVLFAGLHYATWMWAQCLSLVTLMVIFFAVLMAKFGSVSIKPYWWSFAFVAGSYFLLMLGFNGSEILPIQSLLTRLFNESVQPPAYSVTTAYAPPAALPPAIPVAYTNVEPPRGPSASVQVADSAVPVVPQPPSVPITPPVGYSSATLIVTGLPDPARQASRVQISHCAFILILGWVAAQVGQRIANRQQAMEA